MVRSVRRATRSWYSARISAASGNGEPSSPQRPPLIAMARRLPSRPTWAGGVPPSVTRFGSLALTAALFAACAGAAPTPQIIYVTPPPTPAPVAAEPTTAPTETATHDIEVSMKLYGVMDLDIDYDTDECQGDGGYGDIQEGMQVDIKDTHGELVAFATMGVGHVGDPRVSCDFSGTAEDVPDLPVYVLEMGSRGTVNFTRQALAANGWTAELSLGD